MEKQECFTLIGLAEEKETPSARDLKNQLEKGSDVEKVETMKTILAAMLQGETLNDVLMHVIRFVMPSKNKSLKKLCVLYWEICSKYNADGSTRPELIMVCNALRSDLLHPNEFIRGSVLRLLTKLKEVELLEPLVPSVRQCLEHKHPYVRKNAVLAIYSIFKRHKVLIPDAVELVQQYLATESDQGARRNALIMLMNSMLPAAVQHYHAVANQISNFEDQLQMAFIDIIRLDCRNPAADKAKYITTIISLLTVTSASVRYEAATTLVHISSHSSAIKAAAACYLELATKESDNNVKLIVLEKIHELHKKNDRILEDLVMDILRVVQSPDLTVRKRCLLIAMDMLTARNVDEVIGFLKKELVKTHDDDYEKNAEYRQILIQSIHSCAMKYPLVADSVVHVLMEFLTDSGKVSAIDVVTFVKEVMERFADLRGNILSSLLNVFASMTATRSIRGALWIIGEYADSAETIERAMEEIQESVGKLPIIEPIVDDNESDIEKIVSPTKSKVLADGTYATETAYSAVPGVASNISKHPIRTLLFGGDFYVCAALGTALVKLSLRYSALKDNKSAVNVFKTKCMLILTSIIRAGKSSEFVSPIDEDSYERIVLCIRVLSSRKAESALVQSFLKDSRQAFHAIVTESPTSKPVGKIVKTQVDDLPGFRLLSVKKADNAQDEHVTDISKATGMLVNEGEYISKLDHIFPLTGFSDSVYAEAYINFHQFDILIDILIINQTQDTLQNLVVEFSTIGDLKLVERPTPQTVGPHGFHSFKVNFKVSSTESAVIFGNLVYDGTISSDFKCISINEIHVDIMNYIKPGIVDETKFRTMWDEFEWENKVNVLTSLSDLNIYLEFVQKVTNMANLTPLKNIKDCGFLAANLYAKTLFGEDALANICLEETNGKISGHIRIRSKTQGIALSLGEKILQNQKEAAKILKL